MGLIQNLRDKYITTPVVQKITESIATKADDPAIFQVPTGFNNQMGTNNRRQIQGSVDFAVLRSVSVRHETTRAAINTRKRQITQLDYNVVDKSPAVDPSTTEARRLEAKKIISNIGGPGVRFREILDKLIEDTLVLDALTFYKQKTRGGQLLRIIPVDGATIKLRVGQGGETPLPPEPAYEQWIYGKKVADLTTDELTYEMMNPRTSSPYGLSPLETLLITVEASMRAALYNLNYLSDNNIPQGFLSMPESWTVQQIKEYKEFFDSMISGSKEQAKVFPIPSGTTYQATSKPSDYSFKEFFDYLDMKVAILFDIQPQELGLNTKQYKENADSQEKIQLRRGIKPLANFLQEIFTDILAELGYPDFQFKFEGLDGKYDVDDIKTLIPLGVIGIDEARSDMGLPKTGVDQVIINGMGITPLNQIKADQDQDPVKVLEDKKTQQAVQQTMNQLPAGQEEQQKMEKRQIKDPLQRVEKTKTFKQFKKAVVSGLRNGIKPFTKETTIEGLNKLEKASNDLEDFDLEIEIEGLNDFLKWAAQNGVDNASEALNIKGTFNLTNDKFQDMLGDRENYIIESVTQTTKDWIADKIAQGKLDGLTNSEIAKQIADESEDIIQSRANTIVNTEVANAMQTAELDIYRDQGIEEKQWITSEDDKVDEECSALDGEIVKVDEEFSSGDDAPPLHPNCRCYIQAVVLNDF